MTKYERNKIFRLVCKATDRCYIGFSCEKYLSNRLAGMRKQYRRWEQGNGVHSVVYDLLDSEDYYIELLENFPCESSEQAQARVRHYMKQYTNCVEKRCTPVKRSAHKESKQTTFCSLCGKHILSKNFSQHEMTKRHTINEHLRDSNKRHISQLFASLKTV